MEYKACINTLLLTVFYKCLWTEALGVVSTSNKQLKPLLVRNIKRGFGQGQDTSMTAGAHQGSDQTRNVEHRTHLLNILIADKPKRFSHFAPFISSSNPMTLRSMNTPTSKHTLPTVYVGTNETPDDMVPYIDHFSGIRTAKMHFFNPVKNTIPENAKDQNMIIRSNHPGTWTIEHVPTVSEHDDRMDTTKQASSRRSPTLKSTGHSPKQEFNVPSYLQATSPLWDLSKQFAYQGDSKELPGDIDHVSNTHLTGQDSGSRSGMSSSQYPDLEKGQLDKYDKSFSGDEMVNLAEHSKGQQEFYDTPVFGGFSDFAGGDPVSYEGYFDSTPNNEFTDTDELSPITSTYYDAGFFGFDYHYTDTYPDGFSSFGSFNTDTENCDGIDDRKCTSNSECNCYGIYMCSQGQCTLTDEVVDDDEVPSVGTWHD